MQLYYLDTTGYRIATPEEVIAALPDCSSCKHWERLAIGNDYPKGFCMIQRHLTSDIYFCTSWTPNEEATT